MPYIIRSSGGKRTAHTMSSETTKNVDVNSIIDAIKGLSFKFEVNIKLADILDDKTIKIEPTNLKNKEVESNELDNNMVEKVHQVQEARKVQGEPAHQTARRIAVEPRTLEDKTLHVKGSLDRSENIDIDPAAWKAKKVDIQSSTSAQNQPQTLSPASPTLPVPSDPPMVPVSSVPPIAPVSSVSPLPPAMSVSRVLPVPLVQPQVIETICLCVDESSTEPAGFIVSDESKLVKIQELIKPIQDELDNMNPPSAVKQGDVVLAKSEDDHQWYRARVERLTANGISLLYFDWGLRELVGLDQLRTLINPKLGVAMLPPCAQKVEFVDTPSTLIEEFLKCEAMFKLKIISVEIDSMLKVTIIPN